LQIDESVVDRKASRLGGTGRWRRRWPDGEKTLIEAALKETHGQGCRPARAAAKLGFPRQNARVEDSPRSTIDKLRFRKT